MDNTNNFAALRDATVGAQQIQAPNSPLGAPGQAAISARNQVAFQLPQSTAGANASANLAQSQVEEQKRQEAAARAAAAEARQREADLQDFNKYRIVQKDDGGYDFFAPDGSQVDVATLAQRTGVKPSQILKESDNPLDRQYVQDYKNLQNYVDAVQSGDRKTVDSYQAANDKLKQYTDKGGIDKLLQNFKQNYQRYYTPRSANPQAWGYPNGPTQVPTPQEPYYINPYGDSSGGVGAHQ